MFVQFGISYEARQVGLIEDFCPICRTLHPVEVHEMMRLTQVYFITVDAKGIGQFRTTCSRCRAEFDRNSNPLHALDSYFDVAEGSLPRARGASERARLESEIEAGDVSPQFREALLREPFEAISSMVQRKMSNNTLSWKTLVIVLALFLIIGGTTYVSLVYGARVPASRVLPWAVGGCSLASALVVLFMTIVPRRYSRRHVRPLLAQSLQPLQPTLEELQDVLRELKAKKLTIGRIVRAESLCSDIMTLDELSIAP